MFQPSSGVGIPPRFVDWSHFCRYASTLQAAGLIESNKDLYWDIRPQAKYGTIEFRVCDVPATLETLFGLVALARCLVADRLRRIESNPRLAAGDEPVFWLAGENRWLAARYGTAFECQRRPGSGRRSIASDVSLLIRDLGGIARELVEREFLSAVDPGRAAETGAERQRRIYRQSGSWQAVAEDMRSRWLPELETNYAFEPPAPAPPARPASSLPAVEGHPVEPAVADYI
jgi:carboxylate-amine ligase